LSREEETGGVNEGEEEVREGESVFEKMKKAFK
jgi:hypothetical protein